MSQTKIGVLLVVACTLLEGIGQVFLKKSVLRAVRSYLWISFGIVILALEAALYTKALLFLDVGAAYSISSLSLISVTFMSQCLLRERVTRTRWIGVCLIFIGVGLVVARTLAYTPIGLSFLRQPRSFQMRYGTPVFSSRLRQGKSSHAD